MYALALISTRNQFGVMLNALNLGGEAVEVGSHRGDFAKTFLKWWKGDCLYMVDPWGPVEGYEEQAVILQKYLEGAPDRTQDMLAARAAVDEFKGRFQMLKGTSLQAAPEFADGSLSFVYLDGDHRYEAVKEDIAAWWPKLRKGGVLAGHDWMSPGCYGKPDNWGPGVQKAVAEFFGPLGLTVWIVNEEGGLPWSYFATKE